MYELADKIISGLDTKEDMGESSTEEIKEDDK